MPVKKGSKRVYFSKVKEAREKISSEALELYDMYKGLIRDAIVAHDFETASKGLQFIMDHIPADSEGTRLLDPSVDKPKQVEGNKGPTIQIGFQLGGVNIPSELPVAIDITPKKLEDKN